VAVREQPSRAEVAAAAGDVEGHNDAVAHLQVLHRGADLVNHTDELVTERVAHAGVGHHAVEQVQIRTTNRPPLASYSSALLN
jgi:hypothetical protein